MLSQRKTILLVFIALAGFMFLTATAAQAVTLKFATLSPENTFLVEMFKESAAAIEKETEGRVKLKLYTGGVMGNDEVILRKMRAGQIHGATFTAGGMSKAHPNYQIMSLPLLFDNYAQVDAVRKELDPLLTAELEQSGYISFGIVDAGFVYILSNHKVSCLDELKGRKVWVPEGDPIGQTVFKHAGVPPVPLPLSDVLTGLQTGLIDTVMGSPIGSVVLQWYTKVKYITVQPLVYSYGTLVLHKKAWVKVNEGDREIVKKYLTDMVTEANKVTRRDNKKSLDTLKKQGIEFVNMDPAKIADMNQIAEASIKDLMATGNFDKAMLARIQEIINQQGK